MTVHLSPPTVALAALLCAAFAALFFTLGRFAERDARKRIEQEAARRESLRIAADRRDLKRVLGDERDWFGDVIELEKRRGAQRVSLEERDKAQARRIAVLQSSRGGG